MACRFFFATLVPRGDGSLAWLPVMGRLFESQAPGKPAAAGRPRNCKSAAPGLLEIEESKTKN
jgi:hypothetical protein